mmetsp:Transcript_14284/g.26527  ORF Transcript_14284/g.26527 Transcript_14284/m.26527 type:complete len:290 (+) Transcript_14284:76-945(+)
MPSSACIIFVLTSAGSWSCILCQSSQTDGYEDATAELVQPTIGHALMQRKTQQKKLAPISHEHTGIPEELTTYSCKTNAYPGDACEVKMPDGSFQNGRCRATNVHRLFCELSEGSNCIVDRSGESCTWFGFSGSCASVAFFEGDIGENTKDTACDIWPRSSSCPSLCQGPSCSEGTTDNGGLPLANGKCSYYCSKELDGFRYCGSGSAYTTSGSVDCRGCAVEAKLLSSTCPNACRDWRCGSGDLYNGGMSLTDGVCRHYCSQENGGYRYCGKGKYYKSGDFVDCRACK